MKTLITSIVLLFSLLSLSAEDVTINFSVDMSKEELIDGDSVYVVLGYTDWPDWAESFVMLDDDQDGIYTYSLTFPTYGGEVTQSFFYSYGNKADEFIIDEEIEGDCGNDEWIREVVIPDGETSVSTPTYLFNTCIMNDGSFVDVFFQVDMSAFTEINDESYVALFKDGDEDQLEYLYDDEANGIFSTTVLLEKGTTFNYVFAYAADDITYLVEAVPEACATDSLRSIVVADEAMTVPVVVFGSCDGAASLRSNVSSSNLSVYPNPANEAITISAPQGSSIDVYSYLGVKVKTANKISEPFTLSVSDLPNGIYIVSVDSDNGRMIQKFQIK